MRKQFSKISTVVLVASFVFLGAQSSFADGGDLRDTISSVLRYSPTIKSFDATQKASEFEVERSRSGWLPRLDVRGGYVFEEVRDPRSRSGNSRINKDDFYDRVEAGASISQTIWDGMATWYTVDISQRRLESAQSRLIDNVEALALDAALAHIEVYRQRKIMALAELNVKNHEKILTSQKSRQSSGASTLADVTQTQTRLARTLASLTESRSALEVAMANYKRLTGRDAGDLALPAAPQEFYPSLEAAMARAMSSNMKIKALSSDTKAAESQIELNKSGFHPNLSFVAGTDYRNRVEDTRTNSWSDSWNMNYGLRLTWNLFNGGFDWYNVKSGGERARASQEELQALRDTITQEIHATWSQYIAAQEQVRHYANAVDYSTKTRDLYLEQFNVGQRSLLDVLDAENELFSSSIQFVTAQQNVTAAKLRLLTLGCELLPAFSLSSTQIAAN